MAESPSDAFDLPETLQIGPNVDPYPLLSEARRSCPVQDKWPLSTGSAIDWPDGNPTANVLGYEECLAVLRDGKTFSAALTAQALGPLLANTMVAMDGEDHRAHRALVAYAFRPRLLARWEHELVRRVADELIDGFAPLGRADLVSQFNFALPIRVITHILGLPQEDSARFRRWSIELISIGINWERGMIAFEALHEYFAALVAQRRAEPRDDLITELINAEIDGRSLTDEEVFATLRLLLPAGIETTYRSIGNMMYALLTNPDQLMAVQSDPQLATAAVEEALRWQGPIIQTGRQTTQPTTLAGIGIPAGATVSVFLAAGNRDETRFPEPDRFDVRRPNKEHIAFGSGPHVCLGMHLARMEMRIALEALLERLPGLRLDPGQQAPTLVGLPLRSPTTLPVVFTAA